MCFSQNTLTVRAFAKEFLLGGVNQHFADKDGRGSLSWLKGKEGIGAVKRERGLNFFKSHTLYFGFNCNERLCFTPTLY